MKGECNLSLLLPPSSSPHSPVFPFLRPSCPHASHTRSLLFCLPVAVCRGQGEERSVPDVAAIKAPYLQTPRNRYRQSATLTMSAGAKRVISAGRKSAAGLLNVRPFSLCLGVRAPLTDC